MDTAIEAKKELPKVNFFKIQLKEQYRNTVLVIAGGKVHSDEMRKKAKYYIERGYGGYFELDSSISNQFAANFKVRVLDVKTKKEQELLIDTETLLQEAEFNKKQAEEANVARQEALDLQQKALDMLKKAQEIDITQKAEIARLRSENEELVKIGEVEDTGPDLNTD